MQDLWFIGDTVKKGWGETQKMHPPIRAFVSAHSQACECALTGPRVRTHKAASAHSFFTPSTGICSGGGMYAFCDVFLCWIFATSDAVAEA